MLNRRNFLKTAAFTAVSSGLLTQVVSAHSPHPIRINRLIGARPRMTLRFFPYELKLRHVFTVATYSRSTTPDVQVEIDYDSITGYGEASMPPYLLQDF